MNLFITLPTADGNMTLRWDAGLFTAIVPNSENKSRLLYAGHQFLINLSAEEVFRKIMAETDVKADKNTNQKPEALGRGVSGAPSRAEHSNAWPARKCPDYETARMVDSDFSLRSRN
jgi:hypothetical protein